MGKRPSGNRPPSRSHPRPANLGLQKAALSRRYPTTSVSTTDNELVWLGSLTPTEFSRTYEVVISHQTGGPTPLVYVARPGLKLVAGMRLPHVYPLNTLCLYYGSREWNSSMLIADTLVPWTAEWLTHYEVWVATGGEWLGGGIHDQASGNVRPEKADNETRRLEDHVRRKTVRLKRALQMAYGHSCELEALLHNAHLSPAMDLPG
jgi:hypothetical protein